MEFEMEEVDEPEQLVVTEVEIEEQQGRC